MQLLFVFICLLIKIPEHEITCPKMKKAWSDKESKLVARHSKQVIEETDSKLGECEELMSKLNSLEIQLMLLQVEEVLG